MTRREMVHVVEECWQAACDARMAGVEAMVDNKVHGPGQCSMIRFQAFICLLNNTIPKHMVGSEHRPKEPWQE
jgi:hypothetical protein